MDFDAGEGGGQGEQITAIVVRYLGGRAAVIDDDTDDVCPVYQGDTALAAGQWLFAERAFVRCRRSEAVAEVVMVTIQVPGDPADLERELQVAAAMSNVTWGYVRTRISQAA